MDDMMGPRRTGCATRTSANETIEIEGRPSWCMYLSMDGWMDGLAYDVDDLDV